MAILRSMCLRYTLKKPILESIQQPYPQSPAPEEAEEGYAVHPSVDLEENINFGEYPPDLFQLRVRTVQEHISTYYPSTYIYIASLVTVILVTIALIVFALAINVSDGKPWVLGVIVVLILLFISKMSFLSRIEKEHKEIVNLLQSFNDQDMTNYGVLYRIRPSDLPTPTMINSRLIRLAYHLNLGLPQYTIELTTNNHIDEYSFQDHPASDPHASPEEIIARENELPKYHPKTNSEDSNNNHLEQNREIVLGESHPPNYDDIVLEITSAPAQTRETNNSRGIFYPESSSPSSSSPSSSSPSSSSPNHPSNSQA